MEISTDGMEGIVSGLSNEEYHKGPGLSCSGFKKFLEYPNKYKAYRERPQKSTASQIKGQLVHMAVLEPELFSEKAVHIKGPMNRSPFKAQADEAKEAGKIPVGDSDYAEIIGMRDAIMKHAYAEPLISKGDHEVSVYWKDEETGLLLKCRPDSMIKTQGLIADIKYCYSASDYAVQKQIARMQYHIQTQWYLMGLSKLIGRRTTDFTHIFVEEEYPHRVRTYVIDDASLERAMLDIRNGLAKFAECYKSDIWPNDNIDPKIIPMNLPDYAFAYGGEL